MDFQDQQGKNPFNANVLKGGKVDPRSKLYQRSIEGREKLDEMLQRLWDQGADEADVFMAGVRALTSREKGYVGAYLDSKNPGRRYQDNEAKAITDQVMSNLGIGDHPGARLTRPKDGEGKEERKTSNQIRGAFGPGQAGGPPRKAMPVGQQRKLGKRASTGQPLEDSTRPSQEEERQKRAEGRQDYYYPDTDVQKKFMDTMKNGVKDIQSRVDSGQITAEQAVKEGSALRDRAFMQAGKEANEVRRSKGDLTPDEQKAADKKQQRTDELRQKIAEQKGLRDREAAAGPEPDEDKIIPIRGIQSYFSDVIGDIDPRNKDPRDVARQIKDIIEEITQVGNEDPDLLGVQGKEGLGLTVNDVIKALRSPTAFEKTGYSRILDSYGIEAEPEERKRPEPAAAPKSAAAPEQPPAAAPEPKAAAPGPEAPAPAPESGGKRQPEPDPWEQEGPEAKGIPGPQSQAPARQQALAGQPGPKGLLSPGKEPQAQSGVKRKRTRAETQDIQKRGSKELAKTQETNRKLEAMTQRMANSDAVKSEEMRNWINNDLERLLKSFTPAEKTEDPWEQDGPEAKGIPEPAAQAPASQKSLAGQPGPKGLLPPGKRRTEPDPWEQEGPAPRGTPEPTAPAEKQPAALPPGPNRATRRAQGQRSSTKKKTTTQSTGGGGFGGARKAAQKAPEVMKAAKEAPSLEDFKTYLYDTQGELFGKRGFETGGSDNPMEDQAPDPYAKWRGEPTEPRPGAQEGGREPATAGKGQEGQGSLVKRDTEFTKKPKAREDFKRGQKPKPPKSGQKPQQEAPTTETAAPRKGRRTKAEGDEIRRRGQEALEQIRGEARKGREVQSRMSNSPAATGEAPSNPREAEITRRGEEALKGEVYENIRNRPGMTNREANRILREGGYTQPRPGLDAAARTVTEGMDRHDAARKNLPRQVRRAVPKFNSSEYQEFAQSIRAMMR